MVKVTASGTAVFGGIIRVIGNKLTETNALGHGNTYTSDNCGHVKTVTYPNGNSISCGYDGNGNMIAMTDAKSFVTSCECTNNHLTAITDAEGNTKSYEYDAHGNLTRKIDGSGKKVVYGYDRKNNLTTVQYYDTIISYKYGKLSDHTKMSDESGMYFNKG